MQKLIEGVHRFHSETFRNHRELFARLANGQHPQALFVTCCDSRINPNLITQTDPGELFIVRNVGNIIPPYGTSGSAEDAAIEYSLDALGIEDIIVCGHTGCGAMQGLLDVGQTDHLPSVRNWLRHAAATRRIVDELYKHLQGENLLTLTAEENVLVQLENLRTHPAVAVGLASGRVKLHAWMYKIATGQVFAYDAQRGQFVDLSEANTAPAAVPSRSEIPLLREAAGTIPAAAGVSVS